ncbi:MAG: zinc-dependent alcohol dehydrogenase family protein [Candidatus Limnocylindrales bacterium]
MRAVLYERFGRRPRLADVPDPVPPPGGAVIEVRATGLCRSDWHGWMGHDPDIELPHVPGHEFAGAVAAVGAGVRRFRGGERVTTPFVSGCGTCPECLAGDEQVCRAQTQPGFTHWGSFASYVLVHHADRNLVPLPDSIDDRAAALLGCRVATAFRAVADQAQLAAGEWLAVQGCGGVGLSAVMLGVAAGARVVAVDIDAGALTLARQLGAAVAIDASSVEDVVEAVIDATAGGAHVSLDALGDPATCVASVRSLRRRGRHVQVGLLLGARSTPPLPMDRVVAHELQVLGSHGMPAHRYGALLELITSGRLDPSRLIGRVIALEEAVEALVTMDRPGTAGITVIRGL